MSEEEALDLTNRITDGIRKAQKALFKRKALLGETVVVADSDGMPITISAEEALRRFEEKFGKNSY